MWTAITRCSVCVCGRTGWRHPRYTLWPSMTTVREAQRSSTWRAMSVSRCLTTAASGGVCRTSASNPASSRPTTCVALSRRYSRVWRTRSAGGASPTWSRRRRSSPGRTAGAGATAGGRSRACAWRRCASRTTRSSRTRWAWRRATACACWRSPTTAGGRCGSKRTARPPPPAGTRQTTWCRRSPTTARRCTRSRRRRTRRRRPTSSDGSSRSTSCARCTRTRRATTRSWASRAATRCRCSSGRPPTPTGGARATTAASPAWSHAATWSRRTAARPSRPRPLRSTRPPMRRPPTCAPATASPARLQTGRGTSETSRASTAIRCSASSPSTATSWCATAKLMWVWRLGGPCVLNTQSLVDLIILGAGAQRIIFLMTVNCSNFGSILSEYFFSCRIWYCINSQKS